MQLVLKMMAPGNSGEFLVLVLPGAAEIAGQVRVLLQPGVAVGREHLAVGIDVDAVPFGLLEDLLQDAQVVAGNQDRLAGLGAELDRGRYRMAVPLDVRLVEEFHREVVDPAGFHRQPDALVQVETVVQQGCKRLVREGVDLLRFLSEGAGMVCVGGIPLDPVGDHLAHRVDVLIDLEVLDPVQLSQFDLAGPVGRKLPVPRGGRWEPGEGTAVGLIEQRPGSFAHAHAFRDEAGDGVGVEIDVGHRGEQGVDHEAVDLLVPGSKSPGKVRPVGDSFQRVDQQVLQYRDIGLLAADPDGGAAGAFGGLLALETEHCHDVSSPVVGIAFVDQMKESMSDQYNMRIDKGQLLISRCDLYATTTTGVTFCVTATAPPAAR